MSLRLLVVDDDEVMRKLLREVLEKQGYQVALAASGEDAVKLIRRDAYPIVVSDVRMLEMDGLALLREAKKHSKNSAVILMTGFGSMEGAIDAIQQGAFDYISKPFKMDELKALVARAAKQWESLEARGPADGGTPSFVGSARGLIGKSPKIVEVYKLLARAALSMSNVLVVGEAGTGKKMVARAIHENGSRRSHPFLALTCATAETSLETELFGKSEGAFYGAAGGTLFLDEVSTLSPALQIRLMRAMQDEGEKNDVRVIATTQHDLEALVKAGRFREDLYYRLKVISIELPPLRDRVDDLPELVGHFLARFTEKNRKPISHVSEEAMDAFRAYAWPGNIRELEHAIERAVAMAGSNVLFREDFPTEVMRRDSVDASAAPASGGGASQASLEELERQHIVKVLQEAGYNKSRASEILGIDRATLYRKAQRYGIDLRGK